MSNVLTARVASWQARGETLWEAVALFNDKPVFRVDEKATEAQARADLADWAQRMGKRLAWEGQKPRSSALVLATGEKTLSRGDSELLFDCEKSIESGLKTFVEVGRALITVRDKRLYRYRFATFEAYVQGRWGMSVRHAHRLCDAASVVDNLVMESPEPVNGTTRPLPNVKVLPATESQARPLGQLPKVQQREVWKKAVESAPAGQVTAAHVERVVELELRGEDPRSSALGGEAAIQRLALKAKSACAELVGTIKPLKLRASIWHAVQGLAHIENFLKEVNSAVANGRLFAKPKKPLAIRAGPPRHSAATRARLSAIARARWLKVKASGVNSLAAKARKK